MDVLYCSQAHDPTMCSNLRIRSTTNSAALFHLSHDLDESLSGLHLVLPLLIGQVARFHIDRHFSNYMGRVKWSNCEKIPINWLQHGNDGTSKIHGKNR